ncbi:MAG: outer membrane lipoprotein-sorting protein [Myxococcota bacterium]
MLFIILALISSGLADTNGNQWLARIDATAQVVDAHVVLDVEVTDARGRTNPRTIEIWQKGDDQRLVRMIAPARLHGIGLLVTPGDTLHLFLPQYPPARRVVGSKRADAFMGTDFAVEDLSRMSYSGQYDAEVSHQKGDLTQLVLTPTSDSNETPIHIWVDEDNVVREIQHFDSKDNPIRRLVLEDIRKISGTPIAHTMTVTDQVRNRKTTAQVRTIEIGIELQDSLFSVTQLERR